MIPRTIASPATPVAASSAVSSARTSPIATTGTAQAATSAGYPSSPSGSRPGSCGGSQFRSVLGWDVPERDDRHRGGSDERWVALQPEWLAARVLRRGGAEGASADVVDDVGVVICSLREFQGAGGQPDDRLIAQYSARQSRVEVILPDVHAVDVVLRHQGSGDVHAVVDEDHRVRTRVGH